MKAGPDIGGTLNCPRCGDTPPSGGIGGLCPKCFSHSALDNDTGWLTAFEVAPSALEYAWPSLPGWTTTEVLGAGGMGRVYRVESTADGSAGALKVLDARWSRNPLMAARFEAEAHALMKLRHEHIVRVLETGETDDGRFCLVMELVDGCDLGRLLRAEKLDPGRAIDIFTKVCQAIVYAHGKGFAHRDIKPANVLASRDGTVKLVDFGLAKDFENDGAPGSTIGALTGTTDHFGSAYYLAPERMLGGKEMGPPSDIYALGVLLYHLLSGQVPLGKYTPVSQLTGLPRAFDSIIGKSLEASPASRTTTAQELLTGVQHGWRDHLTGAHRLRRRQRLLALVGVLTFAVLTALAGAIWQREQMQPPPPPVFASPSTATIAQPWENSMGMRFVPVPGTRVLFSIWETRRRDVEPFRAAESGMFSVAWRRDFKDKLTAGSQSFYTLAPGGRIVQTASWEDPGFPVTPDHPACYPTVRDAQRFCQWLTWKDQSEGRLKPGQVYRLPTTAEWLTACGGEDAPLRPGNRAGPEARDDYWPRFWPTFSERDNFPRLAPVGSFPAELHGLYDFSGNVSEWTLDGNESAADPLTETSASLRGPSFTDGNMEKAAFSNARPLTTVKRYPQIGFRVVLDHLIDTEPAEALGLAPEGSKKTSAATSK